MTCVASSGLGWARFLAMAIGGRMTRKRRDNSFIPSSHSLQSLHIMHTRDFPHAVDDVFEVLQVFDFDHDIHIGLTVFGAGADVADVGFGVADDGSDLLQHSV